MMLVQVMGFFPGRWHHLGADEGQWDAECGMTKATYHAFINTMNAFVRTTHNRTMHGTFGNSLLPRTTAQPHHARQL